MRHEVEDGSRPGTDAQGEEHIADLAHRGIGEDALDVPLGERADPGNEQGYCSYDGDGCDTGVRV